MVEGAGLAVDGVDEGQLAGVVHLGHMAGAEVRLTPALVVTMVAVLEQHGAAVDGVHDLGSSATRPTTKLCWCGGNVVHTVGTKVIDDNRGVLVGRPNVSRVAGVDGVDAHGVLAVVAPVAANDLRANLEPTFSLPSQGGDGLVVGRGVHVGAGIFVFNLLAYHHLGFGRAGGHEAAEGHLRQQVARDIGVAVVSDAVTVTR